MNRARVNASSPSARVIRSAASASALQNTRLRSTPLGFSVSGFRYLNLAGGLNVGGVDRSWVQDQYGGSADLSYVFPRSFRYDALTLSYAGTYTTRAEPWIYDLDPNTPPPQLPYLGYYSTLRFSWGYSDVERYAYDRLDLVAITDQGVGTEIR